MKEITEKSLQNLWDYCQEAYDGDEISNGFFRHVDQLLGRGEVDFDLVMDFIRKNSIKRVKPATRAKTVREPKIPKTPRVIRNIGGGCDSPRSTIRPWNKSCDEPDKPVRPRRSINRGGSGGCGASTPGC